MLKHNEKLKNYLIDSYYKSECESHKNIAKGICELAIGILDDQEKEKLLESENYSHVLLGVAICLINKIDTMESANRKGGRPREYQQQLDDVYALHKKGLSCRKIATETGIPSATVSRMIHRAEQKAEQKRKKNDFERLVQNYY